MSWAHPAQRLLLWIWVACGLQWMQPTPLVFVLLPLMAAAWLADGVRFRRSLRRTLPLLLGSVLVYGWSVPGLYLWPGWVAPTREGLEAGGVQALRLLMLVTTLRLLLAGLNREQLLAGVHVLLRPCARLGFDIERAARRLALTLYRVDVLLSERMTLGELWRQLSAAEGDEPLPPDVEWRPLPLNRRQQWILLLLWLAVLATLLVRFIIN